MDDKCSFGGYKDYLSDWHKGLCYQTWEPLTKWVYLDVNIFKIKFLNHTSYVSRSNHIGLVATD
jgi:hypothetical protein